MPIYPCERCNPGAASQPGSAGRAMPCLSCSTPWAHSRGSPEQQWERDVELAAGRGSCAGECRVSAVVGCVAVGASGVPWCFCCCWPWLLLRHCSKITGSWWACVGYVLTKLVHLKLGGWESSLLLCLLPGAPTPAALPTPSVLKPFKLTILHNLRWRNKLNLHILS